MQHADGRSIRRRKRLAMPKVVFIVALMELQKELQAAKEAVRDACRLCAAAQRNLASGEQHDKADKSPVTVADYGAQALIFAALAKAFPQDPAVGEEDSADLRKAENAPILERVTEHVRAIDPDLDTAALLAAIDRGNHSGGSSVRFWTLDPIDGTKGFLRGEQYAVALALIDHGEPALGVLGCPNLPVNPEDPNSELGCLLFAIRGQGAYQAPLSAIDRAKRIRTDEVTDPAAAVFCESVESGHTAHGRSAQISAALRTRVEPFRMDSQCKYAAVSRGQASVYLRLPTRAAYEEKIWDHAAGYVILCEAGGEVADTEGNPLDFSLGRTLRKNKGIVASTPAVFDAVLRAVKDSAEPAAASG